MAMNFIQIENLYENFLHELVYQGISWGSGYGIVLIFETSQRHQEREIIGFKSELKHLWPSLGHRGSIIFLQFWGWKKFDREFGLEFFGGFGFWQK